MEEALTRYVLNPTLTELINAIARLERVIEEQDALISKLKEGCEQCQICNER